MGKFQITEYRTVQVIVVKFWWVYGKHKYWKFSRNLKIGVISKPATHASLNMISCVELY